MLKNCENVIANDQYRGQVGRKLLKIQIISLICLSLVSVSFGANYYVSTTGNDANDGLSAGNAWRTVAYAATKALAGDMVYIKAGLYQGEIVFITHSGKENAPIILQGYQNTPGDTPNPHYNPGDAINSTIIPVLEGVTGNVGLGIDKKGYFEIRNLGLTKSVYGIYAYGSHHFTIENVYLDEIGFGSSETGEGIWPYLCNNFIIRNCVVTDVGMSNIEVNRSYDGLVENCKSYAVDYINNSVDYHIVLQDAHNIIVKNCQAYNLHSFNGGHPGHGIGIKDAYRGGYIYGHSYNNKIIDCATYDMGEYLFLAHEAYNNEFVNCTAIGHYDNPSQNYWSEGINIRDGAHDNIFRQCLIEGTRTSIAIQNTEEGPVNADGSFATQTCSNNTISNCIFLNSSTGIEMWNADNNLITNCVFDGAGKVAIVRFIYGIPNNGNVCRNSIVTNSIGMYQADNPTSGSVMPFIYSNFWNNKFSMPASEGNISVDPLFVDPAKKDYHLKSTQGHWDNTYYTWMKDEVTSSCIDKGQPTSDCSLEPSPNGSIIDIGAYGGTVEASKSAKSITSSKVASEVNTEEFTVYPNPFTISSTIKYFAPAEGHVNIVLYDIQGRQIRNLLDENVQQGPMSVQWDGSNLNGQKVGYGVYFLRLTAESGFTKTIKVLFKQ